MNDLVAAGAHEDFDLPGVVKHLSEVLCRYYNDVMVSSTFRDQTAEAAEAFTANGNFVSHWSDEVSYSSNYPKVNPRVH